MCGIQANAFDFHLLQRQPKKMISNKDRPQDLHKFFYDEPDCSEDVITPRYLWTGESGWCHFSHNVLEHNTISKSSFRGGCSESDGSCPCKEFVTYRDFSCED
jgi:hypothetical protein